MNEHTNPVFIVMVGVPGSGKSTIASEISKETKIPVFSSDAIRKELFNNENEQLHNDVVFGTLYHRIRDSLRNGKSCILDSTNVTIRDRKNVFKNIRNIDCTKIAFAVMTDVDECKKRNANRERKVPDYVIERFANRFTLPSTDEGFQFVFEDIEKNSMKHIIDLIKGTYQDIVMNSSQKEEMEIV